MAGIEDTREQGAVLVATRPIYSSQVRLLFSLFGTDGPVKSGPLRRKTTIEELLEEEEAKAILTEIRDAADHALQALFGRETEPGQHEAMR